MKNEKIKYHLFYAGDQFYAYTTDIKLARDFYSERYFRYELLNLSRKDAYQLESDYADSQIIRYDFELSDGTMAYRVPVTKRERLTFEHIAIQTAAVDIYLAAKIPSELFTKKYRDALNVIGYTSANNEVRTETDVSNFNHVEFEPNFTKTFLWLYGDTLKGGNDEVWLSFASFG